MRFKSRKLIVSLSNNLLVFAEEFLKLAPTAEKFGKIQIILSSFLIE